MSTEKFTVAYDGPALRDGSMDVRDLAPALLAVGRLCEEANRVVNEDKAKVAVRVVANFEEGSFEINLSLAQDLIENAKTFFNKDELATAKQILYWLGFITGTATLPGLFKLLKRLKGRQPKKMTWLEDGNVQFVVAEGEIFKVPAAVAKLAQDQGTRQAAVDILSPLSQGRIDEFQTRIDGKTENAITASEVDWFIPPEPSRKDRKKLDEYTHEQHFNISMVTFKEGNKWRVSDGQHELNVTVADREFMANVQANRQRFGKDDYMRVMLKTTTWQEPDGKIRTEYEIVEVLEYFKAQPRPIQLDLLDDQP